MTFSKPTEENILGADSPFIPVNFYHYQVIILKKHHTWITLLGVRLIQRLGSHALFGYTTQHSNSSPHFHQLKVVWLKWVLSVLRHCKETCWVWNWQLGSASLKGTPSCESKNVSFSNPPTKTLWVFEKTLSLPSVLVTSSWHFWRNTVLRYPY